jgi:hypothetical protein
MQRPDCYLMLAGERIDRLRVSAQPGTWRCRCRSVRKMCASTVVSPRVGFVPGLAGPDTVDLVRRDSPPTGPRSRSSATSSISGDGRAGCIWQR